MMVILWAAVLFFVLSPGIVLTLPPGSFFSGKTSLVAAGVHAGVFFIIGYLLLYGFPGFSNSDSFRNLSLGEKYTQLYPVGPGRAAELGYPRGTLAQISI